MAFRKLNENEIKRLHDHLFEFLCEFDDFCQKYNIDYQLNGGNVLGAVRHQDFIPWDDDLDIMLTQKELDKFLSFSQYFPKHWEWSPASKKVHIEKLMSHKHYIWAKGAHKKFYQTPIWIDFFIIEEQGIPGMQATCLLKFLCNRKRFPKWHWRHWLPHWLRNPIRNEARKLFQQKGDFPVFYTYKSILFAHMFFPLDCIFPTKRRYKVRDRLFPGPHDTHKYLLAEYGPTYMTPPDASGRFVHYYKKVED